MQIDRFLLHSLVFAAHMRAAFWARLAKNEPETFIGSFHEAADVFHKANALLEGTGLGWGKDKVPKSIDDFLDMEPKWPHSEPSA